MNELVLRYASGAWATRWSAPRRTIRSCLLPVEEHQTAAGPKQGLLLAAASYDLVNDMRAPTAILFMVAA